VEAKRHKDSHQRAVIVGIEYLAVEGELIAELVDRLLGAATAQRGAVGRFAEASGSHVSLHASIGSRDLDLFAHQQVVRIAGHELLLGRSLGADDHTATATGDVGDDVVWIEHAIAGVGPAWNPLP